MIKSKGETGEWLYPEPIEALMTGVCGVVKKDGVVSLIYTDQTRESALIDIDFDAAENFFAVVSQVQEQRSASKEREVNDRAYSALLAGETHL